MMEDRLFEAFEPPENTNIKPIAVANVPCNVGDHVTYRVECGIVLTGQRTKKLALLVHLVGHVPEPWRLEMQTRAVLSASTDANKSHIGRPAHPLRSAPTSATGTSEAHADRIDGEALHPSKDRANGLGVGPALGYTPSSDADLMFNKHDRPSLSAVQERPAAAGALGNV
jgi:hypothetical protein